MSIVLKIIPKVPAVLLLGVLGLWCWTRDDAPRSEAIAAIRLVSPPIPLSAESRGSWKLDWSKWNDKKGDPFVVAPSRLHYMKPNGPAILVRVHPRESVRLGSEQIVDDDGWFEAGMSTDGSTCAVLDRTTAASIEFRVVRPDPKSHDVAELTIEGWNDPSILESAGVGAMFRTALTVFFGALFGSWFFGLWIYRWWKRRAAATAILTAA